MKVGDWIEVDEAIGASKKGLLILFETTRRLSDWY
jgi:hypothetical protein